MITRLFLTFLLFSTAASAFETSAQQAILVDATTGTTLFAKQADVRMGPSSMSKIMTVYIVLDKIKAGEIKLEDTFNVSENAWKKGGSKMFVPLGERVTVEDLLRGIAIQSGNDACIVIAEGIAGTEEAFAEIMNVKGKQLGLTGSHFTNSTGWPDENHYMTPRDLAILSEALIRDFPKFYPLWSEREFTFNGITQQNRNSLLGELGVDGIKTGHTEAAGYGITTSAEQEGRRLIAVVNGLDSFKSRIDASREIITHGFKNFEALQLFGDGQSIVEAPMWYGQKDQVGLRAEKPLLTTVPKHNKAEIKVTTNVMEPIIAPIQKGQKLGELIFEMQGAPTKVIPLVAVESIDKKSWAGRLIPTLRYRLFGEK